MTWQVRTENVEADNRALVEALWNIVDFERDPMDDDLYSFHRLQEIARAALDHVQGER